MRKYSTTNCIQCSTSFKRNGSGHFYCSPECTWEYMKKSEKTYSRSYIHTILNKILPRPLQCSECGCVPSKTNHKPKQSRIHWANISGKCKIDIEDYKPMCFSCHVKYDKKVKNLGRYFNRGELSSQSKLTVYKVNTIRSKYPSKTMQELADEYGVGQTTVWHVIHNKTWNFGVEDDI